MNLHITPIFNIDRPCKTASVLLFLVIYASEVIMGYWLYMETYVRVLVRSNIARRQERDINYAPKRVHMYIYFHIQPLTFLLHRRYYHKKLNNIII